MANTDNQCSDLKIEDLYSQSKDTLGDILALQKDTQKNVYGWNFENMTLREVMNFWHANTHAMMLFGSTGRKILQNTALLSSQIFPKQINLNANLRLLICFISL